MTSQQLIVTKEIVLHNKCACSVIMTKPALLQFQISQKVPMIEKS